MDNILIWTGKNQRFFMLYLMIIKIYLHHIYALNGFDALL